MIAVTFCTWDQSVDQRHAYAICVVSSFLEAGYYICWCLHDGRYWYYESWRQGCQQLVFPKLYSMKARRTELDMTYGHRYSQTNTKYCEQLGWMTSDDKWTWCELTHMLVKRYSRATFNIHTYVRVCVSEMFCILCKNSTMSVKTSV